MADKPLNNREILRKYEEQKGRCPYCGALLKETGFHIDHIIPKDKGGTGEKNNLQLICPTCNRQKANKTDQEFREYLKPFLDGKVDRKNLNEFWKALKLYRKYREVIHFYEK